jgi:alpha-galactosidase
VLPSLSYRCILLSGDVLTKISPERLAILKKLTPPRGKLAQFGDDSFTQGIVELDGHTMIAVFKWSDRLENYAHGPNEPF